MPVIEGVADTFVGGTAVDIAGFIIYLFGIKFYPWATITPVDGLTFVDLRLSGYCIGSDCVAFSDISILSVFNYFKEYENKLTAVDVFTTISMLMVLVAIIAAIVYMFMAICKKDEKKEIPTAAGALNIIAFFLTLLALSIFRFGVYGELRGVVRLGAAFKMTLFGSVLFLIAGVLMSTKQAKKGWFG